MTNNSAKTASLDCGDSYTIPAGYHNGSGKVTANSLASQTSATATAAQITKGKTAWVNGVKITGTRAAAPTTDSGSVPAKRSSGSFGVVFTKNFETVPSVSVSDDINYAVADATNISKTGFTVKITKEDGTSFDWEGTVTWKAST